MPATRPSIAISVLVIVLGAINATLLTVLVLLVVFSTSEAERRRAVLDAMPGQGFAQTVALRQQQQALLAQYQLEQSEAGSRIIIPIERAMELVCLEQAVVPASDDLMAGH